MRRHHLAAGLTRLAAANWQVTACTRKNQRPRRNRAIPAVLYSTGLQVSELVAR